MKNIIILLALIMYSTCLRAQTNESNSSEDTSPSSGALIETSPPIRFALGIGWTYLGSFQGNAEGNHGGTSYAFEDQKRYYNETQSLSFEAFSSPKNNWGFIGGFQHNGEQSLKEDRSLSQTQRQTLQNPSKMQMNSLYVGTIYRWDIFYIPFGINLGRIKYTPPNGVSTSVENGMGIFLNFGWNIYDYLAFEIVTQNSNTILTNTLGTQKEVVKGIFGTTSFTLKFLF